MKIWKYHIDFKDEKQVITANGITNVVYFGIQDSKLCVWLEVDEDGPPRSCRLYVLPTGGNIPDSVYHIMTIQDGGYIWHLYGEITTLPR